MQYFAETLVYYPHVRNCPKKLETECCPADRRSEVLVLALLLFVEATRLFHRENHTPLSLPSSLRKEVVEVK